MLIKGKALNLGFFHFSTHALYQVTFPFFTTGSDPSIVLFHLFPKRPLIPQCSDTHYYKLHLQWPPTAHHRLCSFHRLFIFHWHCSVCSVFSFCTLVNALSLVLFLPIPPIMLFDSSPKSLLYSWCSSLMLCGQCRVHSAVLPHSPYGVPL